MARALRIEYGGAFYHVMARGNRRERIFRDEADRLLFYQTLGEACERTGWRAPPQHRARRSMMPKAPIAR
jgi:hypothetical protein